MFWGGYYQKKPKNTETSISIVKLYPKSTEGNPPPPPKECQVPPGIELPGLAFSKLAITDPITVLKVKDLGIEHSSYPPEHKLVQFEIKGSRAYVTVLAGIAQLGDKLIQVGVSTKLPENSCLRFLIPLDSKEDPEEEMKDEGKKEDKESSESDDDDEKEKEKKMSDGDEDEKEKEEEKKKKMSDGDDDEKEIEKKKQKKMSDDEEEEDEKKEKEKKKDKKKEEKKKKQQKYEVVAAYYILVEGFNPKKMDNYLFYSGTGKSRPDHCTVTQFHTEWYGDYRRLEYEHGFIQWLFPLFLSLLFI